MIARKTDDPEARAAVSSRMKSARLSGKEIRAGRPDLARSVFSQLVSMKRPRPLRETIDPVRTINVVVF